MKEIMSLSVNRLPPSANHIWKSSGNRRFKSAEYEAFAAEIEAELFRNRKTLNKLLFNKPLAVEMRFYSPIVLKRKCQTPNRRFGDWDNRIKAFQDAVFGIIGIDDVWVMEGHVFKRQAPRNTSIIKIFEVC